MLLIKVLFIKKACIALAMRQSLTAFSQVRDLLGKTNLHAFSLDSRCEDGIKICLATVSVKECIVMVVHGFWSNYIELLLL